MRRGLDAACMALGLVALAACQEKMDEPVAMRSGSSVTESACLTEVAKQTSESEVTVLSSEFSEANTVVMVGVGAQRAPWRCLVSEGGVVQEVSFAGTEGAM